MFKVEKIKKIMSVLTAIILIFSLCVIPASADGYDVDFKYESFKFKNVRLWWTGYDDNGNNIGSWTELDFYNTAYADFYEKDGYVFITLYEPSMPSITTACVRIEFELLYGNTTDDRYNELSFDWLWHEKFQTESWSNMNYCYRVMHDGSHLKGTANYIEGQQMPTALSGIKTGRGYHFDYGQSDFESQTIRYGFQHSIYFGSYGSIRFCIANTMLRSGELSTQQIIDNQNQNTQDIIDNQNKLQEDEKNEANTTGNSGVNDITGAIPTDTDGILNAFKSLTNSMMTTSTTCKIEFPGITIPKVGRFFNEVQLLPKQEINFKEYIGMIPYKLLLLVQSLLTIALIIYCFKELYATISYVLTLRGGGDSE